MKSINKVDIYRISSDNATYEIFKSTILGTGAYSTVYMGRCISSKVPKKINRQDKLVAIKKVNMRKLSQNSARMLLAEIGIMKELMNGSHPNIVECYDVIDDLDVTYIIMEYCDGGDLSSLLIGKQFKNTYLRYYFGQILNAIKFLRDNKIIHRDMKPKNILLSSDKKVIKLCDFGFAKHVDSLKRVTTICGSPLYMAPELYKKESYTESVDIWSLGIILFEMVFGLHPFAKCGDVESLSISVVKNDIHVGENTEVNQNCLNLLRLMLKKYDFERISIDELFEHVWVKNDCILTEGELLNMFLTKHIQTDLYSISSTPISEDVNDYNMCEIHKSLDGSSIDLIFELDS